MESIPGPSNAAVAGRCHVHLESGGGDGGSGREGGNGKGGGAVWRSNPMQCSRSGYDSDLDIGGDAWCNG